MDGNTSDIDAAAVNYTQLTMGLVCAYVANNSVPTTELAALIATLHAALTGLGNGGAPAAQPVERLTPAQIRKSITHEALISFEDGKPYRTLKRHLTKLGLAPETYREKWGLPADYPMTAPSYSEMRSTLARELGLGQFGRKAAENTAAQATGGVAEKPKRVGQPRKVKAAAAT